VDLRQLERRARRLSDDRLFDLIADAGTSLAAREVYRGEVHARADQMIAESEGRRLPPNPTVHEMFAGTRVSDERSITAWLRRHAPEVAALWPEAPLGASWLDWRTHAGQAAMPVLDQAWSAVTGRPIPWETGPASETRTP
jgi:hypothetical protein